jgi:hypothetical protein
MLDDDFFLSDNQHHEETSVMAVQDGIITISNDNQSTSMVHKT